MGAYSSSGTKALGQWSGSGVQATSTFRSQQRRTTFIVRSYCRFSSDISTSIVIRGISYQCVRGGTAYGGAASNQCSGAGRGSTTYSGAATSRSGGKGWGGAAYGGAATSTRKAQS